MSVPEEKFLYQLRVAGFPEPVREIRFHPVRKWRFDCGYPEWFIAIEIEGGSWAGGRHVRGTGFEKDLEKYAEALLLGWKVLRVSTKMVNDGRALAYLEALLKTVKTTS
jgi:hypothetical protein